jgi:ribonuclease D
MLAHTFPGIQNVQMQSFLDFANLNSVVDEQVHFGIPKVKSGLSGVTEVMLNRVLNKKQQLSNWEQRPLSDEQTKYGGK